MWIGTSIVVIATGAVLAFAIEREVDWINLQTTGWILIVLGAIGLLWSLLVAQSLGPWRRRDIVDG